MSVFAGLKAGVLLGVAVLVFRHSLGDKSPIPLQTPALLHEIVVKSGSLRCYQSNLMIPGVFLSLTLEPSAVLRLQLSVVSSKANPSCLPFAASTLLLPCPGNPTLVKAGFELQVLFCPWPAKERSLDGFDPYLKLPSAGF